MHRESMTNFIFNRIHLTKMLKTHKKVDKTKSKGSLHFFKNRFKLK